MKAIKTWITGHKLISIIIGCLVVAGATCAIVLPMALNKEHEHEYSSEWKYNENEHYHICLDENCNDIKDKAEHSWNDGVVTKQATEDVEGEKEYTCTVCNAIKKESIDKLHHTHTFEEAWSKDEAYHWHKATCEHTSEVSEKAAHTWNEGTIKTPATEDVEGEKEYTCTECGATKNEPIEKLPHTHKFEKAWSKDEAYHWHKATCEHTSEVSGKAAHTWNEGTIKTPATEDVEGEKEYTCTECGAIKKEPIEKLPHTHKFEKAWSKDEAYHWHKATCEHTSEVSGKAAHTWNEGTIKTPATEDAEGEKEYTCTECGAIKKEPIEKLPHTHKFEEAWTNDESYHWHKATCEHTSEVSAKAEHTADKWTEVTAADYGVNQVVTGICKVCTKSVFKEVFGSALDTGTFTFMIESVETNTAGNVLVYGRVRSGQVEVNDILELIGYAKTSKVLAITKEKTSTDSLSLANCADKVWLTLEKDITEADAKVGRTFAKYGYQNACSKYTADVTVLESSNRTIYNNDVLEVCFFNSSSKIVAQFLLSQSIVFGTTGTAEIVNKSEIVLHEGFKFKVYAGSVIIGNGVITKTNDHEINRYGSCTTCNYELTGHNHSYNEIGSCGCGKSIATKKYLNDERFSADFNLEKDEVKIIELELRESVSIDSYRLDSSIDDSTKVEVFILSSTGEELDLNDIQKGQTVFIRIVAKEAVTVTVSLVDTNDM